MSNEFDNFIDRIRILISTKSKWSSNDLLVELLRIYLDFRLDRIEDKIPESNIVNGK